MRRGRLKLLLRAPGTAEHTPVRQLIWLRILRVLLDGREHGVVRICRARRCHLPRSWSLNR